jgi:cytochrome c oxidase subunit 1
MLDERIGKVAFWMIAIGIQVTYYGQFLEGMQGMPRRVANYSPIFQNGNDISSVGAYVLMAGFIVLLYDLIHSWRHGEAAPANPWHSKTLEWAVPTPVPLENFLVDPVVTSGPYTYGTPTEGQEAETVKEAPVPVGSGSSEEGAR